MHSDWEVYVDLGILTPEYEALIVVSAALGLGSSVQCRRAVRLAA
jgi:hypothetical protein